MKKIALLILCAALLLSAVACGAGTSAWQEQYDLGVRYLSDGNYEEAIIAFTAAIEIEPMKADAYLGRAEAYIGCGETEENLAAARADYEKVIELDASRTEGYLGLADVYIRQEEYEKAQEILEKGLEKTGNDQAIADKLEGITEVSLAGFIGKPLGELADYLGMEYTTVWWSGYTAAFSGVALVSYAESMNNFQAADDSTITSIECADENQVVLGNLGCRMTYDEIVAAVGNRVALGEPVYDTEPDIETGEMRYRLSFELGEYWLLYCWENDPYHEKSEDVVIGLRADITAVEGENNDVDWVIRCYKEVLNFYHANESDIYTLYDIDKNGVPELLVYSNGRYNIYRMEDGLAVLHDKFFASEGSYYGLYEYDGNGMLVYDGGVDFLHAEYVSLYNMSYENFPWAGTMISTEDRYSYAEIQEYLEQYTKIETFSPVTDYTLLESMTLSAA